MPVDELRKIHPTSYECYTSQGPGIGSGDTILEHFERLAERELQPDEVCLDVGFGDGTSLQSFIEQRKCKKVYGIDIAQACETVPVLKHKKNMTAFFLDICHKPIPLKDDTIDLAFCLETIEHLANPYHMVAEVKRVLKHGGLFTLAYPDPDDNLGYDCGQHAHVYPFFLKHESFERFMMQMYFKKLSFHQNGSSSWYLFKNYKGPDVIDVFEVVSGNYTEQQLYGCLDNF